jgi:hypothetical protein
MKIVNSLFICALIFIFSCSGSVENNKETTSTKIGELKETNLLNDYSNFLSQLDSANAATIPTAVTKYKEMFKSESDILKDSAFVLYNSYYKKVDRTLNEIMGIDTTNFDSLIFLDANDKPLPLSKKLKAYKDKIEKNGFKISSTEGNAYIEKDGDYVATEFYPLVSAKMKTYLEQLNKENKEGFQEDAGLTIEPKVFIDRVIWWEIFIDNNTNFLLLDDAKENKKYLLTFLMIGMDNTQVVSQENTTIENYFRVAYTYLQTKFPNSKTNKIIAPYFNALLKKDKQQAEQIINSYEKQKLIIDFHATE